MAEEVDWSSATFEGSKAPPRAIRGAVVPREGARCGAARGGRRALRTAPARGAPNLRLLPSRPPPQRVLEAFTGDAEKVEAYDPSLSRERTTGQSSDEVPSARFAVNRQLEEACAPPPALLARSACPGRSESAIGSGEGGRRAVDRRSDSCPRRGRSLPGSHNRLTRQCHRTARQTHACEEALGLRVLDAFAPSDLRQNVLVGT